jgi:hypothetical protein
MLKVNEASGVDNVHCYYTISIENAECLSKPFLYIFSESVYRSGTVRKQWKWANVTAIFEEGKGQDYIHVDI